MTRKPEPLVDQLRWRARHQPHGLAYRFLLDGEKEEETWTYEQLDRRARAIGALLQTAARPGDRALLLFPPGPDFIAGFLGCLYAKVIAVPADPPHPNRLHHKMPVIDRLAADARPSVVLLTASLYEAIQAQQAKRGALENAKLLVTDTDEWDEWADRWHPPEIRGRDTAFLQYTSGSTTDPKGILVSHANLFYNLDLIERCFAIDRDSSGVIWLPPYHDMGLIGGLLAPLFSGLPVTLLPNLLFLQRPLRWLQAISRFGATISGGPNFAYELCVHKIQPEERAGLDLSRWAVAFNGAEPVYHKTLSAFAEYFAPCGFRPEAFLPCYGLAESTLMVSGGPQDCSPTRQHLSKSALEEDRVVPVSEPDDTTLTLVSCGQNLLPEQEIAIVNPETRLPCTPDAVGEYWLRGPCVTQGYWQKPAETEVAFGARLANGEAKIYLRSGDLGFLREGELYVTGRIKNLIIVEGKNHYPQDIERTVAGVHPAIWPGGCAVFSYRAAAGERVVVIAEVKYKQVGDPEAIKTAIRSAVSLQHGLAVHAIQLTHPGSIPPHDQWKDRHFLCKKNYQSGLIQEIASA